MNRTEVAADLRSAVDVLKRDGWALGDFHEDDGCHCVVGAIAVAVSGDQRPDPDLWEATSDARQRLLWAMCALADYVGSLPSRLLAWNDAPGRTADEVIAALEAAADAAEGKP